MEMAAAERWVTKEVRSGEIGFSGPVRKNNFTAQQGRRRTAVGRRGAKPGCCGQKGCQTRVLWAKGLLLPTRFAAAADLGFLCRRRRG